VQFKRAPAIEDESELSWAAAFPREGAGRDTEAFVATEDAPCTSPGIFPIARPRVEANESSPLGALLEAVEPGSVCATAPADWT
jgi:hypothetical protein